MEQENWFEKNKKIIVISGIIIGVISLMVYLKPTVDNSANKTTETSIKSTVKIDDSEGKNETITSRDSKETTIKDIDNESVVMSDTKVGRDVKIDKSTTTTNNNYYATSKEKPIDVIYKEINITGIVIDSITEEKLGGVMVKLPEYSLNYKSDSNGKFILYKNIKTYNESATIKVEDNNYNYLYTDNVNLNSIITIKLKRK